MRTILHVAAGLLAGFVAGIVLSHALAVIGIQFFRRPIVVFDLPVLCALAGAVVVPMMLARRSG